MSLNENQERRLSSALHTIEARLAQIDVLLASDSQTITAPLRRHLRDEQRQRLRELRAAMLGELAALVDQFALPPGERDEVRVIDATLAAIWVTLEELRGGGLSGSGAVDPAALAAMAPYLDRMLALVEQMQGTLPR
jgi:hypothetical protein